jgi:hypothetical protein
VPRAVSIFSKDGFYGIKTSGLFAGKDCTINCQIKDGQVEVSTLVGIYVV